MTTTLQRHAITETEHMAHMIDDAAKMWPELAYSRAELLRRLIEVGHDAVVDQAKAEHDRQLKAIKKVSGSLTGIWPEGAMQALKDEWPE